MGHYGVLYTLPYENAIRKMRLWINFYLGRMKQKKHWKRKENDAIMSSKGGKEYVEEGTLP